MMSLKWPYTVNIVMATHQLWGKSLENRGREIFKVELDQMCLCKRLKWTTFFLQHNSKGLFMTAKRSFPRWPPPAATVNTFP